MASTTFNQLSNYATRNRLAEPALDALCQTYLTAEPALRARIEQRVLAGASWIAVSRALGRARKHSMWELVDDQTQAGLLAIIPSLRSYEPFDPETGKGTTKSFSERLKDEIDTAMKDEYLCHLSAVTRSVVDGTRLHDLPLGHRVKGTDGQEREFDLPDGSGSVLDQLIRNYEEQIEKPARERAALQTFIQSPITQRRAIAAQAGMTNNAFETASRAAREQLDLRGKRFNTGACVPLTQELRDSFIERRARKGMTIHEVTESLAAAFNSAGIKASAASAYTLLHAATPTKNQSDMPASIVTALDGIYTVRPDTHYIATDPPFRQLTNAMSRTGLTRADFLGLLRGENLINTTYTVDHAIGSYKFLTESRSAVPIAVINALLPRLAIP